jgi:hypothetical protein
MMQTSQHEQPLTLLDVVTAVSGLTDNEAEAAAVINHMLCSERIVFRSKPQEIETLLS